MAVKVALSTYFDGGWSTDQRIGQKHSAAYIQGFDVRKSPSQLSVLPGPRREDGGIMKDLVLGEVMLPSGKIVGFGNLGYLYSRTTTGTWSAEGKVSTGAGGIDYRHDTDDVYLTSAKTVSRYKAVSTSPQLIPDYYGPSASTYNNSTLVGFNVNAAQSGSSLSTAILIATTPLSELSTAIRYFQSDIEPLQRISVFVTTKGTGDYTLTLHDGLNTVLGTVTVPNASIKANNWNDFVFSSQVRIYIGSSARTYHFHLTSTVADGFISSSSTNDLSTVDVQVWADRFVQTNNGLHPMIRFQQYEVFGNGNYLSVWEPISDPPTNAEWQRHRLTFPQEFEVCGVTIQNEFLVVAAERNTTTGSLTPQGGILFFWDGVSATYNYFVQIPEGSPYTLSTYLNMATTYVNGDWLALTSAQTLPVKLRHLPGADTEFTAVNQQVATFGTTGNPFAASLTDNFNASSSTPDPSKWAAFGNAAQTNGLLQLTSTLTASSNGISSQAVYDLTNSQMQCRVVSVGNQALTSFEVYPLQAQLNSNNFIGWYINQGQISALRKISAVTTLTGTTTFTSAFQYLRIRDTGGVVYWDYSIDGVNWNNLTTLSESSLFAITSLSLFVTSDTFNTETGVTSAQVDDFNITIGVSPITLYPSSSTVRRGIHLLGYPGATTNSTIPFGVYSYGSIDKNYPASFTYNYAISTGSQFFTAQNNLRIGMVQAFGDILHISWRDDLNGGYGIDVVDNSSPPAPIAIYRTLIVDNGYVVKPKGGKFIESYYSLPVGSTLQFSYQLDSSGVWVSDPNIYTSTNLWQQRSNYARFTIPGEFREVQGQVTITSTSSVTTPPIVSMVAIDYDDKKEQLYE